MNQHLQLITQDENSLEDRLKSSLQTFETGIFLIALQRYPHALTSCVSAIEGGIKGKLGERENEPFLSLLARADKEVPALQEHDVIQRRNLRDKRNEIVHSGFSPKDDNISVHLLLTTGFPLLQKIYKGLYHFDLRSHFFEPARKQLDVAKKVHSKVVARGDADVVCSMQSIRHWVYWYAIQQNVGWQVAAFNSAELKGLKFEYQEKRKAELKRHFSPEWVFDCPICDEINSVVASFCHDIQNEIISIRAISMACVNCGFFVPRESHLLAETLLEEQIGRCSEKILKEYGLGRGMA
jgi:hypothetical protein